MKILFICHANVCRSFMAGEFLQKELPEAEVFSRGLYADPSYRVPEKIKLFLEKNGIAYSPHIPALLAKEDLAAADLVFLMEKRHLEHLTDRYAQYTDKLWLLADYAFNREEDLEDPIALSGRAFEKNARRLLEAVRAVAVRLKKQCR